MASLHDADALLIYQVGPVRCCAPTGPVEQIVLPPDLTHPPGSDAARPGIFRHGRHIVSVIDLRQRFGIDPADWQPGRLVITQLTRGYTGFWVDRIVDVIRSPTEGWGGLPPHLPRDAFSRTLLYRDRIHLYTDFEQLPHLHPAGFLRQYLARLEPAAEPEPPVAQPVSEHQPRASQSDAAPGRENTPPPTAATRSAPEPAPTPSSPPPPAVAPPQQTSRPAEATTPAPPATPTRPTAAAGTGKPPSSPSRAASDTDHPAAGRQTVPPVADTTRPTPAPPTMSKSAPTPTTEETGGGFGVLLVLLLLLGAGAAGVYLWYPTGDIPDPLPVTSREQPAPRPALPTPPPERLSEVAPRSTTGEPIAPAVPTEAPARPEPKPEPEPEPEPESDSASAPQTPSQAPTPAADTPHLLGDLVRSDPPYRARIEQDSEGITLIFEAPAPAVPAVATSPDAPLNGPGPKDDGAPATPPADGQADAPASDTPSTPPPRREEIVHVVARGDTLWDIAQRYVDNPWRYPELAENSEIHDPDRIYPGDKVRIIIYRGRQP
ncbi:chemotaxis protein CheW [Thiohalophilus sp.]|uniref:chemotaxis protein CheW n=1 Tax=Thiohalophilus sp. TaxID=3028392 RepID=UPI002ACE6336|nr:chemotaxis protein CheW [Thiohalophilus sp.]MDZ7803880.1 chemotaxis protein CheW [Thiohalophilus sp.]